MHRDFSSICFVGVDNYPVLSRSQSNETMGGESVQQTLLARAFAEKGYDTSTVVKDSAQPSGEIIDGIRVLKAYAEDAGLPGLRFFYPRMFKLYRALAEADADVYFQSCAGAVTGLVAWFCRRNGRQFVYRLAHDTDCIPGQQLIRFERDRRLYEYGLRHADLISAQGSVQHGLLRQHYGLGSEVVNMAVERPREAPANRDIDVLWVNNLRDFKRPDIAVDIARSLPELNIVMIGGQVQGHEDLYKSIVQAAQEVPTLDFVGAVPYAQVNDYFARSKVFLNTSDSEGFPNSFLQAWARGVPVISFFDPDGLIERERLGASPSDQNDMAEKLRELVEDSLARQAVASRCVEFVEREYTADAVAGHYVDAIRRARSDGNQS